MWRGRGKEAFHISYLMPPVINIIVSVLDFELADVTSN